MKKAVKLFILIIVSISQVFAQHPEKFVHGEMRIENDIYNVEFVNGEIIYVANESKNKKVDVKELAAFDPPRVYPPDLEFDLQADRRILHEVLANKLNLLKDNRETIKIFYAFNAKGDVVLLQYNIPFTTLITPTEIAKIDQRIRNEIKGRFLTKGYESYPIIYFSSRPTIFF